MPRFIINGCELLEKLITDDGLKRLPVGEHHAFAHGHHRRRVRHHFHTETVARGERVLGFLWDDGDPWIVRMHSTKEIVWCVSSGRGPWSFYFPQQAFGESTSLRCRRFGVGFACLLSKRLGFGWDRQ